MARFPFISAILLLLCSAAAADGESSFLVSNHIRMVSDSLREKEASVLEVIGNTHHALSFARFAHRFGKKYEGDNEMKLRFAIFSENLDLIRATNRKRLPYKLAVNKFADLTWEEFRSHRLGAAQNCSATLKGNHKLTDAILPEKKDWREEGIVSPVKDQGDCGSCWTFSSTGALEAAYKQAFGKGISLSEQQLVDCAGAFDNFGCNGGLPSHAFEYIKYNGGIETETAYPYTGKDALEAAYKQAFGKGISLSEQQLVDCAGAFDNFGCNGGLPSHAFEYIKYNGGIETETAYPYTGKDGICKFSSENVAVQVLSSVNITLGAEDELKHAVGLVRPVSVAFQANREFSFYGGGVFTSKTCGSTPMDVNHAVVAVGYGVEDGVPYWLIKNSWGAEWGDNGYFKMEMGKNMCGVATCASYPIIV